MKLSMIDQQTVVDLAVSLSKNETVIQLFYKESKEMPLVRELDVQVASVYTMTTNASVA
jgi:hypothetical protein